MRRRVERVPREVSKRTVIRTPREEVPPGVRAVDPDTSHMADEANQRGKAAWRATYLMEYRRTKRAGIADRNAYEVAAPFPGALKTNYWKRVSELKLAKPKPLIEWTGRKRVGDTTIPRECYAITDAGLERCDEIDRAKQDEAP